MSLSHGFPPLAAPSAQVLILGSLPGKASLAAGEYYAHKQNAFWRLMGDLLGAGPEMPYAHRAARLRAAGIAVWDVIASGERRGSLDADIVKDSVQVNDFPAFFAGHRHVERIYFNGAAAEAAFRRHVLPGLPEVPWSMIRLPSTSPAHAASSYAEKLLAWSAIAAVNK